MLGALQLLQEEQVVLDQTLLQQGEEVQQLQRLQGEVRLLPEEVHLTLLETLAVQDEVHQPEEIHQQEEVTVLRAQEEAVALRVQEEAVHRLEEVII